MRLLSALLALAMLFVMVPAGAFAATDSETTASSTDSTEGDFKYIVDGEGNATITGYTGSATTVEVPSSLAEHTVVAIGDFAFNALEITTAPPTGYQYHKNCKNITSITLPTTLKKIGNYAFSGTGLQKITIPESVTNIGESVFYKCADLKSATLPKDIGAIAEGLFSDCSELESITIPKGVRLIRSYAFDYCTNLQTITFEGAPEYFYVYAFRGLNGLKDVYHSEETEEGWKAFVDGSDGRTFGSANQSLIGSGVKHHFAHYLTFNLNGHGGDAPERQLLCCNVPAKEPANPTDANYTFKGWAESANSTTPVDWTNYCINRDHTDEQDRTLYAIWTPKQTTTDPSNPGGDSGNTGDNTGSGSGNTGDNTGSGSGNTGDNTGSGSGNTGSNPGPSKPGSNPDPSKPGSNPDPSKPDSDSDSTKNRFIISHDDGELFVNDDKKEDAAVSVAEGDKVRLNLPEEDRTKGDMVFRGWVLDVQPNENASDVLDVLKKNGFDPTSPDTTFTVPELPKGTQLHFRADYVTPDQAGQDDDFMSTAAAVVGGAALTGLVAWNSYNIYAEVYMKQIWPVLPQNRQELALALWQDADKPACVDNTLYTDVDEDDADTQTAARWAVENELMKPADKDDLNVFDPYRGVTPAQVYRAWEKAQKLKAQ